MDADEGPWPAETVQEVSGHCGCVWIRGSWKCRVYLRRNLLNVENNEDRVL